MTLADNYAALVYNGNDSTTEWSVTWRFDSNSDLVVILIDSDGIPTTLILDTHYTVTGAGGTSGIVTYPKVTVPATDPMATGEKLVIKRDSGLAQPNDVTARGNNFYDTTEDTYDETVMKLQELDAKIDRAALVDDGFTGDIPSIDNIINLASIQIAEAKASTNIAILGNGSPIPTGDPYIYIKFPFDCTLTGIEVLADQTGSVVLDVRKFTYAQYDAGATHPVAGDSIINVGGGGTKPTISSGVKYQDTTLLHWTKAISAGDYLGFNIDSLSTIESLSISLTADKG